MAKSLKYFLSGLLLGLLFLMGSCEKSANLLQKLDENTLLLKRKKFYQGSLKRQANSDALIAINPDESKYYQGKSMAHTKIGDYHIAFPLLEKAWELNPKETGYYYGWLLLYYYRDYPRALDRLKRYDDFTPDQPDFCWGEHINYLKGLCYKQMGDYSSAIREFDLLIDYEGEHVDVYAYVYRGICFMELEKFNEAIESFNLAIANYPQCAMAYFYKGLCYRETDFPKLSKEAFYQAKALIEKGYFKRHAYHEAFDAVSLEMVNDYISNHSLTYTKSL